MTDEIQTKQEDPADSGFEKIEPAQATESTDSGDDKKQDKKPAKKPKSMLRKAWTFALCAGVIFLILYLGFFSESSVMRGIAYQRTIDSLKSCIAQQEDSLNYYRTLNRRLSTDPTLTEQVVREQYNMKRDNEDVYIFKSR